MDRDFVDPETGYQKEKLNCAVNIAREVTPAIIMLMRGFPLMTILYTTHPYLLIANMHIKIQNTTNNIQKQSA